MNRIAAFALLLMVLWAQPRLHAKDLVFYQEGELVKMESVSCGYDEKSGQGLVGTMIGSDSTNKKMRQTLCPEYVLLGARVEYRIRPKEEKNPTLLPVGEKAEFRMKKSLLLLRVHELDGKEREYVVVSMQPRENVGARTEKPLP